MNVEKNKEFYVDLSLYLVLHEDNNKPQYVPILEDKEDYVSIDHFHAIMEVLGM